MVVFEVEFLTGVSVAASPYHREEAEWPPHPDRLFQALVAAWGRSDPPDMEEREALEWLENLNKNSLILSSPAALHRDVTQVFVPPNDAATTGKKGDEIPKDVLGSLLVIPAWRRNRKPRAFPAMIPVTDNPLRYIWQLNEEQRGQFRRHRPALSRLAREVVYLGHPHSLTRVALSDFVGESVDFGWMEKQPAALRVPYAGRLQELREVYDRSHRQKYLFRPNPSLVTRTFVPPASSEDFVTLFDQENITVLAGTKGFTPMTAVFPLIAKRLRDALLRCSPTGEAIPALVSGHEPNGQPAVSPHLAIIPLADVGWRHSGGRLMGLALVWPRLIPEPERLAALRCIIGFLQENGGTSGSLHFGKNGSWSLTLESESGLASLHPARYVRSSQRWRTVLPVVLDRHPKNKTGESLIDIVARACRNIGLPDEALDGLKVEPLEFSPVKGAPSVREVLQSLPADSPYRNKPFVHLSLCFSRPVRGPLLLGAGRFRGLGLCLPLCGEIS